MDVVPLLGAPSDRKTVRDVHQQATTAVATMGKASHGDGMCWMASLTLKPPGPKHCFNRDIMSIMSY